MSADPRETEIRAFMRSSTARSYSAIAEEIAARFGSERAWPAERVREEWRAMKLTPRRRRAPYARDAEVMAFIADRAGLIAVSEILSEGVATFGKDRFPSRTRLYILVREHAPRTRLEPRQPGPAV